MEANNDNIIQEITELFNKERKEWTQKIATLSNQLKNIRTVTEAQVELYSQRQILIEYSHKLLAIISKMNSVIRKQNAQLIKKYATNLDIRYQNNERKNLIEDEMSPLIERIELTEGHRKFIEQTIQTIDHMLYGIKSRIALEDYLRASTIK